MNGREMKREGEKEIRKEREGGRERKLQTCLIMYSCV